MALFDFGHGEQPWDWFVRELRPPMFSRVYLIESGWVEYASAQTHSVLAPGTLYIFPSHRAYRIEHDPDRPFSCLWFHMSPPSSLYASLTAIPLAEYPRIARLMAVIGAEIDDPSPSRACLEPLVEAFTALCHRENLLDAPDSRLRDMLEYMRAHHRSLVSIEQISEHFGYSKGYFVRLFAQLSGFTPHQYLISCRMTEAIKMLKSDMPLEEIALRTGYSGAKSFSSAFRHYYGMPPHLYRTHFTIHA